jgi:hypothetical protein
VKDRLDGVVLGRACSCAVLLAEHPHLDLLLLVVVVIHIHVHSQIAELIDNLLQIAGIEPSIDDNVLRRWALTLADQGCCRTIEPLRCFPLIEAMRWTAQ